MVLIFSLGTKNLDHFRGKNIGVIFQKAHFVQSLTIKENLYLPSMLAKSAITSGELNVRSDELLLRLRLDHKANSLPRDLSMGEQQRASIWGHHT